MIESKWRENLNGNALFTAESVRFWILSLFEKSGKIQIFNRHFNVDFALDFKDFHGFGEGKFKIFLLPQGRE